LDIETPSVSPLFRGEATGSALLRRPMTSNLESGDDNCEIPGSRYRVPRNDVLALVSHICFAQL
jgi:hypothetical protein